MEPTYHIPTPKTPKKPDCTRDDRLRIQTLYYEAGFTQDQICLQTGFTLSQVRYALAHRLTPQKSKTGRKLLLNTPQRKRLIEIVELKLFELRSRKKATYDALQETNHLCHYKT
ncbi:hypothetical protein B0O99DRAFT_642837 [Bisporella sp. PMI_857]|nr:hypothetical protein B0O99DRAFT_642837 [Bisporella sp. PMI_857]